MNEMEPAVSTIPYQVCVGNHEHYYNFSGYRSRFSMLGEGGEINNLFHSFDVGGVHFAAFSTEHDFSPESAQVQWLAKDLAAVDRTVTPWVVVFGHKPLYCSTDDYYDCQVRISFNVTHTDPLLHGTHPPLPPVSPLPCPILLGQRAAPHCAIHRAATAQ
jgi:hypothetical protein